MQKIYVVRARNMGKLVDLQKLQRFVNLAKIVDLTYGNDLEEKTDMVLLDASSFPPPIQHVVKSAKRKFQKVNGKLDNKSIKLLLNLRTNYKFDLDDGRNVFNLAKAIAAIDGKYDIASEQIQEAMNYMYKKVSVDEVRKQEQVNA